MKRSLPAVLTAGLLIAACGGSKTEPAATTLATDSSSSGGTDASLVATLVGHVTDSLSGSPISGARVSGEGVSTVYTATDGSYRIAARQGTYTLTASRSGYNSMSQTVKAPRKGTYTADFALTPTVVACSYSYGPWGTCSNGTQTRTVLSATPEGCTGTPVTSQTCSVATCTYTYSAWGTCQSGGTQTRTVLTASPDGCAGTPVTSQTCTPTGGGSGGTISTPAAAGYKVFANNDLGMHCVDASFAVFSILPPYNVVDAQVVALSSTGKPTVLGSSQVAMSYSAIADATGSINSTSIGKSDFWTFAQQLYGAPLAAGQGLQGMWMPKDAPSKAGVTLPWDAAMGLFKAPGIPIFPVDDAKNVNRYPLMRFSASDGTGKVIASTDVVLPVSEETSCANCHATGKVAASASGLTWANDTDLEAQARKNVLVLHNSRNGTSLQAPVLCATCHYSPALDLDGTGPSAQQSSHATMSSVMHAFHANKMTGLVDSPVAPGGTPPTATLQACYQCHPGAKTQCLRGAMTQAVDCQNCHGGMAAVGGAYPLRAGGSIDGTNDGKARRPWLDLPRCQSCHANDAVSKTTVSGAPPLASDGLRFVDAYVQGDTSASPILASNKRFAEETNKLYRKSKGHGGLACEACHGSTHAIWSANANDNVAATQLQGHAGVIGECSACHLAPPTNGLGGPHGMHPVGSSWVSAHPNIAEGNRASCQPCHGTDYRGTVLSRTFAARTMAGHTFAAGTIIGCYDCHNGPNP